MNAKNLQPHVYRIDDNSVSLKEFKDQMTMESEETQNIILSYPTVYIHNWKERDMYDVYIGESNNILQRTKEHYTAAKDENNWQYQLEKKDAKLYIIGHEHFNKSMTLDIENRLMMYMMSVDKVRKIHNKKSNPQNRYYPDHELEEIFRKIWRRLRKSDADLFPVESRIKDSAVFKSSPLHKLTTEQENAKELIIQKVFDALREKKSGQLIFIEGEAGTGKTVLNSSTFYELYTRSEELNIDNFRCCMMVNHDEQIRVYEQIASKLGLTDKYGKIVYKPTSFINHCSKDEPVDVAFVDEAHLLLTQGKYSYQGKNQLQDILERAKVVVVMFDENQILTTEQYWEDEILSHYKDLAKQAGNYIELKTQLRMAADKRTLAWIDAFTKEQQILKIPQDSRYQIKIFHEPAELEKAIKERGSSENTALSRMVATYDWEYNINKKAKDRLLGYWEVIIGKWHKPWNYQLEKELTGKEKRRIKTLSWAEQPQTINEIGSTYTIHGFDLNYVGVILGPSVKYRDGQVVFDANASCNEKATRNRTLSDGTKQKFGEKLIQHEVRVLMTRGVNGLYIYACDENLRKALLEANKE